MPPSALALGRTVMGRAKRLMKPSALGIQYLLPIFSGAIGYDDAEFMRQTQFDPGNLSQPYHSVNTDVHKRIHYLEPDHE